MARFLKDVLRPGVFRKGKDLIRVTGEDIKRGFLNFEKMKADGYKVPVIIEHAKPDDPEGLPVKSDQVSARDRAKYQAGWADTLTITEDGVLQVAMDVKSKDGLKLIKDVGTFISPQFGPWTPPGEAAPQPMTITHFALTPYPVDIGQNATFTEIPDSQPIEAAQLSQLVSFSMADMIPDEKPDLGDTDKDDDSISDDSAAQQVKDQLPPEDNSATFGQIVEALGQLGVVLPQGTDHVNNPQALLAGLLTCLHHTNQAKAADAAAQQANQEPTPGQNPNIPDPRLQGTKQENTFTMSQATAVTPDIKTLPEFVQMSQAVDALTAENTLMKRERYATRISNLVASGRMSPTKAAQLSAAVQTYQFSLTGSSTDIVKLDAQLELAEELPEGAILSGDERVKQMGLQEQKTSGFFSINGSTMDPAEEDADLDRHFGKVHSR